MGMRLGDRMDGLKPGIMMVIVQTAYAIITILYKLAANNGTSLRVLIAYRFMFAAASMVPIALYVDRKGRTKPTWRVWCFAFLVALFGGSVAQNLYTNCMVLTSATFAASLTNLTPALTFLLAILLRMEGLDLRTLSAKAKVVGTLICIGGAMVLTFVKGPEIHILITHVNLMRRYGGRRHVASSYRHSNDHIFGSLMGLVACSCTAISYVFQSKMSQMYPYHYTSAGLISIMGAIQAITFAICFERDLTQWKLGWNIKLIAVSYGGIVASGLMTTVIMRCARVRGPLFISIFNPLMLIIVAIMGSLFMNEKLHLGSVLGSAIVIIGLYMVLWGKSKDLKKVGQLVSPSKGFNESIEPENANVPDSAIVVVAPTFYPVTETDSMDQNSSISCNREEEVEFCRNGHV